MADRIRWTGLLEFQLTRLRAMFSAGIAVSCLCSVIRGVTLIDGTVRAPLRNTVVDIAFSRPRGHGGGGQSFFSVPPRTNIVLRSSVPKHDVELQAAGRDFNYASEILFSGHALPTRFLNSTHVAATIPAEDMPDEKT